MKPKEFQKEILERFKELNNIARIRAYINKPKKEIKDRLSGIPHPTDEDFLKHN